MTSSNAVPPIESTDALFLDFDGTLVELAPTPMEINVRPDLPALLGRLARRLHGAVAVVSGRSLADLATRLAPYDGALAGLHGLEQRISSGAIARPPAGRAISRARAELEAFCAANPDLLLEDKGGAIALHFRARPDLADSCRALAERICRQSSGVLSAMHGKMVAELCPREANKGRAVLDFLEAAPFAGRRPVFVGDDRTDEDGFEVVNRLGGVSIHVGASPGTRASFRLSGVPQVRVWLAAFAMPNGGPGARGTV